MTFAELLGALLKENGTAQLISSRFVCAGSNVWQLPSRGREEVAPSGTSLMQVLDDWKCPWTHPPQEWQPIIREKLELLLAPALRERVSERQEEKLRRAGLLLHLRLMREILGAEQKWDSTGRDAVRAWLDDANSIQEADAYWVWGNFVGTNRATTAESVKTRIVAAEIDRGLTGVLTVSLVDWKDSVPLPPSGFVPHPDSFIFCLTESFAESFSNSRDYLERELGIWPENTVVEWSVRMEEPLAVLNGGSAGAAIALATGSLLARRHGDSRKSERSVPA
jgi:hypothetical protein